MISDPYSSPGAQATIDSTAIHQYRSPELQLSSAPTTMDMLSDGQTMLISDSGTGRLLLLDVNNGEGLWVMVCCVTVSNVGKSWVWVKAVCDT